MLMQSKKQKQKSSMSENFKKRHNYDTIVKILC